MSIKYYKIDSASRILLGEKVSEFKSRKIIAVNILDRNNEFLLLEYRLVKNFMEGNAIIHKWIKEIDEFQNCLTLKYNFENKHLLVENIKYLQEKWKYSMKRRLEEEFYMQGGKQMIEETERVLHSKENFEKQFSNYTLFRAFFEGVHSPDRYKLNLVNYLSGVDLNLDIETERVDERHFRKTAKIDEQLLDKERLNKILREMTHTIDAKAELEVDMEEIYVLDEDKFPKEVDLYLDLAVMSGFYHITNAHRLVQISENDFDDLIQ